MRPAQEAAQEALLAMAASLPVWRDAALVVLALIVVGCLYLWESSQ